MTTRLVPASLVWIAFACQAPVPTTAVVAVPSAEPVSEPEAVRDAGPDVEVAPALPPPFDQLGQRCKPGADEYCDARGRIAGVFLAASTDSLPLRGARVHFEETLDPPPGRLLEIAMSKDLIGIRHATCLRCNRPNGFVFIGDLARLSDADLAGLQQRIGLPPSTPPLRTRDDWARTYASDGG